MKTRNFGFTLVEVIIVMTIVGILYLLVSQSLFRGQQRASLAMVKETLVQHIREQQIRAMMGDTAGGTNPVDFSVRLEDQRYILYSGTYDSANSANTIIELPGAYGLTSITIPNQTLTFVHISGDMSNFISGEDSFEISSSETGDQKTLRVNVRGVVFEEP